MFKTLFFWIRNARYQASPQSMLPAITALVFVSALPNFHWISGILSVVGVLFAHWGANLLDDYFDFRSKSVEKRKKMLDGGMRARGRKCQYLLSGATSEKRLFGVAFLFCFLAGVIGFILWRIQGEGILICTGLGAILAFFYSAPPFRLSFHGLGELTAGLLFGPILMAGVAFSASGTFEPSLFYPAISIGLLIANVLYVHSIMDFEPDRQAKKITLAVLCGSPKKAMLVFNLLFIGIYLPIILGVCLNELPWTVCSVFLTVPLHLKLYFLMKEYVNENSQKNFDIKIQRFWWFGPMGGWENIEKAGIGWFMVRWYLARNLMTLFCLLLIISILWARFSNIGQ